MPRGKGQRCSGYLSSDGRFAYCTREEHAGQAALEQTDPASYRHILEGECRCGTTHREAPPELETTYDYVDQAGKLIYQVVRKPGKKFLQRRPDGEGGWIWDIKTVDPLLYRLPQVLEAAAIGNTIYIAEGEKDVHAIERAGAVATCNSGGAGKWRQEHAAHLKGANVIIIADLDPLTKQINGIEKPHAEGQRHALAVAATIPSATILQPAHGKDVSDHLATGHTLEELQPFTFQHDPIDEEDPHSWTPIDLISTAANPPEPPIISNLVYPGRRHLFSGEPESLKSWAAMVLCVEQIRLGNTVLYADFEMGGRETLSRLRDIGLTNQELTDHFIYLEPDEPFQDPLIRQDTDQLLRARKPTLIIIDAFTGALQVHQLDPNKSIDIETFYRQVVDPLRAHNAAVVVLDHLPKDPTNRGRFAIGSERKVGAAEVHLGFEVITPFGRGRIGKAKITTHKDRPGYLQRPRAAELDLTSDPHTGRITWELSQPDKLEPGEPFRPTHLMEKVSAYLELQHEPKSWVQISEGVTGRKEYVGKALDRLTHEGYVTETAGTRGARLFTTLKPYREETDDYHTPPVPTCSPPVPGTGQSDPVPPIPPLTGGTGHNGNRSNPQNHPDQFPTQTTLEQALQLVETVYTDESPLARILDQIPTLPPTHWPHIEKAAADRLAQELGQ